jgi:beta-glucosidase
MLIALSVYALAVAAPKPPKKFSVYDAEAKKILAQMTLEEKVGQMTQPDHEQIKDLSEVETLFLGSVLSGGNSDPKAGNSLQAWTDLYDSLQQRALKTRLGIPLLYGVDAVHGHNNVLGAVIFPHNIGLGATRNAKLVERISRLTAEETRATGPQWTFAPCVASVRDIRWGRTYEGFSEDPEIVKVLGEAAVRGLQGTDLSKPLSLLACAKHYIGDGGTAYGTGIKRMLDQGDMKVDEASLRRIHLPPYIAAIEAGVGTLMPSYSSWNGVKCSASKRLLTEILKGELGFEGFLISDYNALDQIDRDYKKAIGISINAGMDMVMVTDKYRRYITLLKELVNEGTVPMARIDDAVLRILRVKIAMGLMDKSRSQLADRNLHAKFGSAERREVARQAVRESLVVLKNDNRTLPVSRNAARIHVAGKSADDIGNQCGGWTIEWQGKSGAVTPGGTTILEAIKRTVSAKTQVTFSKDGSGATGATLAIAVVGEAPYAEMMGDKADLKLDAEDLATIAKLKEAGIPVVVVLVSGRPLVLDAALEQANAFVAAWLPGTEGQGVADVLFGAAKPKGKLSFSWPRSMAQLPVKVGDANYDPLFKAGYGLGW